MPLGGGEGRREIQKDGQMSGNYPLCPSGPLLKKYMTYKYINFLNFLSKPKQHEISMIAQAMTVDILITCFLAPNSAEGGLRKGWEGTGWS